MRRTSGALAVGLLAATAVWGCSSDSSDPVPIVPPPETCADGNTVGTVCAGVPPAPLCAEQTCTLASCTAVIVASSDAELADAIANASAGQCIALAPGAYGDAVLPDGVSLLGRSADEVSVRSVELSGGSDAHIQGMTVEEGGIKLDQALNTTIHGVKVKSSERDGLELTEGAFATVTQSEFEGSDRYGISAIDASVSVEATILQGQNGPGLWVQCSGGCDCTGSVSLALTNSIVRDSKIVGVSLVGAQATMSNVEVSGNTVDGAFTAGAGMSVSGCSDLTASGVRVADNTGFGVLIDDSNTTADAPTSGGYGLEVVGNLRGIWVQHIGASAAQQVELTACRIADNDGVGLGIGGESTNVSIRDSAIENTALVTLPVLVGGVPAGSEDVGDGINWLAGSQAIIDGLTISGSSRASILIDGAVGEGSSIANVTATGGDDTKGIVQQSVAAGGLSPTVTSAPDLQSSESELFPIPEDVAIPPGM